MIDIDVTRVEKEKFEKMCQMLFLEEDSNIKPIDGKGGDDGMDSVKGAFVSENDVYQVKCFSGRLNEKGRKNKILNSFNTAKAKVKNLKKWVLVLPIDFTVNEKKWFEENIKNKNSGLEIDYWGKTELESKIVLSKGILERYFDYATITNAKKIEDGLPFILAKTPIEKIAKSGEYLQKLSNENKYLGISYNIKDGETKVLMNPTQPIDLKLTFTRKKEGDTEDFKKILERAHNEGTDIVLSKENTPEIECINFPNLFPEGALESVTISPTYKQHEMNVSLEIPDKDYSYEVLIFKIDYVNREEIKISSKNKLLNMSIIFNRQKNIAKINLSFNFKDKTIREAIKLIKLVENLSNSSKILLRDLKTNNIFLIGKGFKIDLPMENDFNQIIRDIYFIECETGKIFNNFNELTEEEIITLGKVKGLLSNKPVKLFFKDLSLTFNKELSEKIIKEYDEKEKVEMGKKVMFGEYKFTFLGEEFIFTPLMAILPELEILNLEDVKSQVKENKEAILFKFKPLIEKEGYVTLTFNKPK